MPKRRYALGSLKRRPARVTPRLRITIFCEGANSEPLYLEEFAKAHGNGLVSLRAVRAAGCPRTLLEKALAEKKSRVRQRRDSYEEADQIWLAFDRDQHPRVQETLNEARSQRFGVAFSNPCFELWPILHFADQDAPIHRHAAQKKLATYLPSFAPRGSKIVSYHDLQMKFEDAAKRAARLRERRQEEGDPTGNPYTDIDLLLELIVSNGRVLFSQRN